MSSLAQFIGSGLNGVDWMPERGCIVLDHLRRVATVGVEGGSGR